MAWTRKHKIYSKPRKPFDKQRIEEENKIIQEYGLKNKREIWKAEAAIGKLRRIAKRLITAPEEKQRDLFTKLNKMGLKVASIPEVLALNKSDWISRRLQTVMIKRKLAKTPKQARQMIVHKQVMIEGQIVNQPSYVVSLDEEAKISIKERTIKTKPAVEATQ
jgi:small subunit ribosomal protein S4